VHVTAGRAIHLSGKEPAGFDPSQNARQAEGGSKTASQNCPQDKTASSLLQSNERIKEDRQDGCSQNADRQDETQIERRCDDGWDHA
ncbi:hypothetical protein, partial [Mesorhizobium sp.]|uniref:hypothetical protein n=1 Tax=Mesorhizobium sp. TaxID=1871066 RepID=UPI0025BB5BB4